MYNVKISILLSLLMLVCFGCHAQVPTFKEGKTIPITRTIDLQGKALHLPQNVTLKFEKGGCFKNGSIIADNTSVIGYKQDIFDNVNISGRWNVEYISTDMFKDLTAVNSLKNVFALTSNKVNNVLIVEKGNYRVSADNKNLNILSVPSNTEVILNGVVTLEPNDLTNYYIVDLKGENIKLHGNGQIIGDKQTHTGTRGEWGMGIMLRECSNVDIYDLTIKDCWGDCIYIGDNTSGVRINNCTLDHGRRQGISITSATNVTIENCIITNVGGTAPEYAIDIEPNKNETVDSVFIKNVKSENCKGGILSGSGAANSCTRNIFVSDCYVGKFEKRSYCFSNTDNVKLVNNVSDKGNKPNFYNCTSVSVE